MATLLLAAAGASLGGLFGGVGAVLGQAAGAIAGSLIDQALFGETPQIGRLGDVDIQTSTEGAPIPRVYGRVRLAGQVIWMTRFEEEAEHSGGKGLGPKVKTYRYFANVAVALCEGRIAHVGRVWANGELLDREAVMMRVHAGGEQQEPDSLILAKEGEDHAPAYRGTAYVVFERLPLADYGNALPQFSFEVIRPVGALERRIRAVTLIPGASEFALAGGEVQRFPRPGLTETENRHAPTAASDLEAALDELMAVCPNLESVGLVVSWFGDDLRAGHCRLTPKVEHKIKQTSVPWSAGGLTREQAEEVSRVAGRAAYGGTPSDASVVEAIKALKARGLKVMFYPFVMMDIAPDNTLPDPYGGARQAAFPWRGRITCHPAPGQPGSPDGTAAAAAAVAAFTGSCDPGDFSLAGGKVVYSGPAQEWSLRRMILHYARLCDLAGGVDCFLIGSELRGLTTLRGGAGGHPFVSDLKALAAAVRTILGPATAISYAADWSEYFGHQPADGSGDVTFHLDPLWADPDIDFVGIDAYFPLTDWRDGEHADAAVAGGPADRAYLAAGLAGGEQFDWYYADAAARAAGQRSPISDGAYGKPWVFRPKDLFGWWSNLHVDRAGGVETGGPTAWLPGLKPIRLTEVGCPAVDAGGNQPNVFPDTLSSEGGVPHFSHGRRDDAAQRRYLEAVLDRFDPDAPGFIEAMNPRLVPGGPRMVETARCHAWTFDARPFPWFPHLAEVWADGGNWETGHWLNGRLGAAPLGAVLAELAADAGAGVVDADGLSAVVDGLVVSGRAAPREIIDLLAGVFGFTAAETAGGLRLADRDTRPRLVLGEADLAEEPGRPLVEIRRAEDAAVPTEVAIAFFDTAEEGRPSAVAARRDGPPRILDRQLPVFAAAPLMAGLADFLLADLQAGRERVAFSLPPTALGPEVGDCLRLVAGGGDRLVLVERIEDGPARRIEGRVVLRHLRPKARPAGPLRRGPRRARLRNRPLARVLDLPLPAEDTQAARPLVAAFADPWPGRLAAHVATGDGFEAIGSLDRPAVMGTLVEPLAPGRPWILTRGPQVEVELHGGTLASASLSALLDGANLAAIGGQDGAPAELVQFAGAELTGERRYRLTGLVRGLNGTEAEAAAGHPAGAAFLILDGAVPRLALPPDLPASGRAFRLGDARLDIASPAMAEASLPEARAGMRPLSPVHLRARRAADGAVEVTWIRRTRIGGDRFEAAEVPLGEAREAYSLTLYGPDAAPLFTTETTMPAWRYTLADQLAHLGGPATAVDVAVAQLSDSVGPGRTERRILNV